MHAAVSVPESQSAGAVFMVRPAHFAFNPQTAGSNAFQSAPADGPTSAAAVQEAALREFEGLADRLVRAGVEVRVGADSAAPAKPDAVFPNNWVSFHADGTVVLYPMLAPNRRLERREDLLHSTLQEGGFKTARTVDLSHRESAGEFLEGTGSLVLDRPRRIAYAGLSPRTHLDVLGEFAQQLDYELVAFEAFDAGIPVYHTNVLLAVGTHFAVVCSEVIADPAHRLAVRQRLGACHDVLEISARQMHAFAGTILELATADGPVIALSTAAWQAYEPLQRRTLERHGSVVAADIPVIERFGGGGVRCMLAEIHLPKRSSAALRS